MKQDSPTVIVIGGSLVGLSAAVFLAAQGVRCLVVERHAASLPHPRAIGFTPRTLELFRSVGLGEQVPQAPPGMRLRRAKAESLAGRWFEEVPWTPATEQAPEREYSPCRGAAIAQDRLEPILRQRALELGAELRLGTELLDFEQDDAGVSVRLRQRDGSEATLRAEFLIAADGHRSPVREALGIGRSGRGHLRTVRSIIFRAPLAEYLERGVHQFNIQQPGFEAFLTTYNDGRWLLIFPDDGPPSDADLRVAIARAIGRDDVPVELVTTGRWEVSALVADRFSVGRVFLAGDAAHTLPPNRGGYGANTGIEDAHNLAWELAAVARGDAAPSLLDSYDAERRPIALLRHQQIFAREDFKGLAGSTDDEERGPIYDDVAMELGQLYRSRSVLDVAADLPPAQRPDVWAGQPGARAPHHWIEMAGRRCSTLDLFQGRWLLLTDDAQWDACALPILRLGRDFSVDDAAAFRDAFGWRSGGASLIRPDGYVAWRARDMPQDPKRALSAALAEVGIVRT